MIPAYVINLTVDDDRLSKLSASLAPLSGLKIIRIEGIYGSSLPDDICIRLTGDPYSIVAKGALGCFLSHVRAWELIAQREDPWAIIFEDDALVQTWDPDIIDKLPASAHLVFANDRTQLSDPPYVSTAPRFSPIIAAIQRIEQRGQAVGGDCYFISKIGAQALVDATAHDGYFSHVDMRLLAYSVDAEDVERLIPNSDTARLVSHAQKVCRPARVLNSFTMQPPISHHMASPETTRTREDREGLSGAPPKL